MVDIAAAAEAATAGLPAETREAVLAAVRGIAADDLSALGAALDRAPGEAAAYALLGEAAGAAALGADPEEAGRGGFRSRLDEVRKTVCRYPPLRLYCAHADVVDGTTVGALTLGALLDAQLCGVSLPLIACIVARIGIRRLCGGVWAAAA